MKCRNIMEKRLFGGIVHPWRMEGLCDLNNIIPSTGEKILYYGIWVQNHSERFNNLSAFSIYFIWAVYNTYFHQNCDCF